MKLAFVLAIILFGLPCIYALDTSSWDEVTVNKVTFKIPEKFSNGTMNTANTCYKHGEPFDFLIFSLIKYDNLKSMYGSSAGSSGLRDVEHTEIAGHPATVLYEYNNFYNHDYLEVFFATGEKIFRIQYNSSNLTDELREIIKSSPQSNMSKETFFEKLDNAQSDYEREEFEKNLELDMEDYYRTYNDNNKHNSFYYFGSNGFGVGGSTRW